MKLAYVIVFVGSCFAALCVPDKLKCAEDKSKRSTDRCLMGSDPQNCEGFKGDECKKELSEYLKDSSPQLKFFNQSVVVDPKNNDVCVRGLTVDSGESIEGRDVRGVYVRLRIVSTQKAEDYNNSTTFVFNGNVTRNDLKDSLFCMDLIDWDISTLTADTNFVILTVLSLPPTINREAAFFGSFLCDIPRVIIETEVIIETGCKIRHHWQEREVKGKHCKSNQDDVTHMSIHPPSSRAQTSGDLVLYNQEILWISGTTLAIVVLILVSQIAKLWTMLASRRTYGEPGTGHELMILETQNSCDPSFEPVEGEAVGNIPKISEDNNGKNEDQNTISHTNGSLQQSEPLVLFDKIMTHPGHVQDD